MNLRKLCTISFMLGCLHTQLHAAPLFGNPQPSFSDCQSYARSLSLALPGGLIDPLGLLCNDQALESKIKAGALVLNENIVVMQTISKTRDIAAHLIRSRFAAQRLIRRSAQYLRVCRANDDGSTCFRNDLQAKTRILIVHRQLLDLREQVRQGVAFVSCTSGPSCIAANAASAEKLKVNLVKLEFEVDKTIDWISSNLDAFYRTTYVIDQR